MSTGFCSCKNIESKVCAPSKVADAIDSFLGKVQNVKYCFVNYLPPNLAAAGARHYAQPASLMVC